MLPAYVPVCPRLESRVSGSSLRYRSWSTPAQPLQEKRVGLGPGLGVGVILDSSFPEGRLPHVVNALACHHVNAL